MNIVCIVDEFPFFLPKYLDDTVSLLKARGHTITAITPLITPKGHKTLYTYIIAQWQKLGLMSLMRLGFSYGILLAGRFLWEIGLTKEPFTIRQVARKHMIQIIASKNVNDPEYLEKIRDTRPDIILSSCSQIFRSDILRMPAVSCINRHSGLLPSYGGLFPVFQAMIHDEPYVGTTVHKMVKEIDGGEILAQKRHRISDSDTLFGLYRITYEISVPVTVDAVSVLTGKKKKIRRPGYAPSYYSFPKSEDWNLFWKKGKKII